MERGYQIARLDLSNLIREANEHRLRAQLEAAEKALEFIAGTYALRLPMAGRLA
jgi:hypothetical protein